MASPVSWPQARWRATKSVSSAREHGGKIDHHGFCGQRRLHHRRLTSRAALAYTARRHKPGGPMGNTVLVVDDLPDARYRMGRPLATAGFDVRETATGRDACGWHACGSTPSRWA